MIAAVAIAIVALCLFHQCFWRTRRLPPGPMPLPLFGNTLSFLWTDLDVQVRRWHRRYGDIMTLWLGSQPLVTLHNAHTILATFVRDADVYADRPYIPWSDVQRGGQFGIALTTGALWRENRRFALQTLRTFGLGKNVMQERVLQDVAGLVADFRQNLENNATEFNLQEEVEMAVGSVISRLTFGYGFSRSDTAKFGRMKRFAAEYIANNGRILFRVMEEHISFLRHLPFFKNEYEFVRRQSQEIQQFFYGEIEEHRRRIDFETEQEAGDFVEAFLRHKHDLEQAGSQQHHFSLPQLFGTIMDLWVAGLETTSNTLAWLCVYLIDRPEIQTKLQSELDAVIASDRLITSDDKAKLPFVNAVIAETQRFCNLIPLNIEHKTTRSVVIEGYSIPAGTMITNQISTVLMDPRYFPEPEQFKPERFLDAEGKFFQPPELMPFSVGKRSCLGESLARLELFLFTANIFNHFNVGLVEKTVQFHNNFS